MSKKSKMERRATLGVFTKKNPKMAIAPSKSETNAFAGFSRAADSRYNSRYEEDVVVRIGDVASGIHCQHCNELCANDSILFHHIREHHPEVMFAKSSTPSNSTDLSKSSRSSTNDDSGSSKYTHSPKPSKASSSSPRARKSGKKSKKSKSSKSSSRPFRCQYTRCREKFKTADDLREHVANEHAIVSLSVLNGGGPVDVDDEDSGSMDTATLGALYGLSRASDVY